MFDGILKVLQGAMNYTRPETREFLFNVLLGAVCNVFAVSRDFLGGAQTAAPGHQGDTRCT